MPPSRDEASLNDDEFVEPEDPVEQECFKRRLMATANSLKKKQQQLRADQDLLADRWTLERVILPVWISLKICSTGWSLETLA